MSPSRTWEGGRRDAEAGGAEEQVVGCGVRLGEPAAEVMGEAPEPVAWTCSPECLVGCALSDGGGLG